MKTVFNVGTIIRGEGSATQVEKSRRRQLRPRDVVYAHLKTTHVTRTTTGNMIPNALSISGSRIADGIIDMEPTLTYGGG